MEVTKWLPSDRPRLGRPLRMLGRQAAARLARAGPTDGLKNRKLILSPLSDSYDGTPRSVNAPIGRIFDEVKGRPL